MIDSTDTQTREIWFESAGTRLFASVRGRGLPVVFLHGGLADHQSSVFRVGSLAATHQLITPDLRGAGRSTFAGELTWDLLADDVAALMRHQNLDRAIVGGYSAGAAVALRFALRHPQRTLALLLDSPLHAGAEHGATPAQQAAMDRIHDVSQRMLGEGMTAVAPLFSPATRNIAMAMARRFDLASVAATLRFLASGARPFERAAELATLSTPTLVIPGTDAEHPAEIAHLLAQALPNVTLATTLTDLGPRLAALLELQSPLPDPPR